MATYTNHEVIVNHIIYNADFEIVDGNLELKGAIEGFEDGSSRECTLDEKTAIYEALLSKFSNEIAESEQFDIREGYSADLADNQNDERKIFKNQ